MDASGDEGGRSKRRRLVHGLPSAEAAAELRRLKAAPPAGPAGMARAKEALLRARLSAGTRLKYAGYVRRFAEWRQRGGLAGRITPEQLADWVACLWLDGAGGSTRAAVSAVRDSVNYSIDSKELRDVLRAIWLDQRRARYGLERRGPLPVRLVREFAVARPAGVPEWEWQRDRALLLLAMRLLMRPGEAEGLERSQVRFGDDGWLYIRPPSSKNDPANSRSDGWEKPVETSLVTTAMAAWLQLRGAAPGPLWLARQGGLDGVAPGHLNRLVKRLTSGRVDGRYTGHSVRIGGATAAVAGGVSVETVQAVGGWFSAAVLLYLRAVAACAAGMSAKMGL